VNIRGSPRRRSLSGPEGLDSVRTLSVVDATEAASLAGVAGVVLGGAAVLSVRLSERSQRNLPPAPEPPLAPGVLDVLAVLRSSAIVLDSADAVIKASPSAYSYGLVRGSEVTRAELVDQARAVRRDGVIRESEFELPRGPLGRGRLVVGVRVAPLGSHHVLLLVEDRTQARRVEEVRRDFVANVSHELKTPVGGMALLAEAISDASDDPEAVRRFAERMQGESVRLTRLVKEIVDLSRLQVADTLHDPELVAVDTVVNEAVDRCRLVATSHDIALAVSPDEGAKVYGDLELLITAVRNLVDNAIAYSPDHTRVAVGVRREDGLVEISVTDQGVGIADAEQARIFERFYRVDPARSRATGGTGLGLAIVKHVCANHGGDVTVWSREGQGATFTMRLPDAGNLPIASRSAREAGRDPDADDELEDE
jgi:two-component system, OmpR family, sensor histidine kinase SenX3